MTNTVYPTPLAAVNALAPPADLCGRVETIREAGAFAFIPHRYPDQIIDLYSYHNMHEDGGARYILIVRRGIVTTCSCPDHKMRGRACKHMALLAEQLVDERTVKPEELMTPAPPAPIPAPYHSFPACAQLIAVGGGYLDIRTLAGSRQGGFFYMETQPDQGRRIETRRESQSEARAREKSDRSARGGTFTIPVTLDAGYWK